MEHFSSQYFKYVHSMVDIQYLLLVAEKLIIPASRLRLHGQYKEWFPLADKLKEIIRPLLLQQEFFYTFPFSFDLKDAHKRLRQSSLHRSPLLGQVGHHCKSLIRNPEIFPFQWGDHFF